MYLAVIVLFLNIIFIDFFVINKMNIKDCNFVTSCIYQNETDR